MSKTINEIRQLKAEMDKNIAASITDAVSAFERESGVKVDSVHSTFHMVSKSDMDVKYEKVACVKSVIDFCM